MTKLPDEIPASDTGTGLSFMVCQCSGADNPTPMRALLAPSGDYMEITALVCPACMKLQGVENGRLTDQCIPGGSQDRR